MVSGGVAMSWLRMLTIVLAGLAATGTAQARIQTQMFCWITDVEFPVACAEDEDGGDDDEGEEAEYDFGHPATRSPERPARAGSRRIAAPRLDRFVAAEA